jgi:microcystin-dependent protein
MPMIGTIMPWAGKAAPSGWLLCQGQTVSISSYQKLFNVIGFVFGGNLSTAFALPDYRGRFPAAGQTDFIESFAQGGAGSVVVGLQSFPSGTSHTHTIDVSFPNSADSFSSAMNVRYTLPADTTNTKSALVQIPNDNTVMGVAQVNNTSASAFNIYGFGQQSGSMCVRAVSTSVNVTRSPSWQGTVLAMEPIGQTKAVPLPIYPPYNVVNFIICFDGTTPTFSDEVASDGGAK